MNVRFASCSLVVLIATASAQTPMRPKPPAIKDRDWIQIPFDCFILAPLEAAGIKPAPEATRAELIGRLTRGLCGRPATKAEIEAFVALKDKRAYEKAVDRLVQTPEFTAHYLEIARLLKTREHASARAAVRRVWGRLLVGGLDEHPTALQWLTCETIDPTLANCCDLDNIPEAWDAKHLARAIAISAAFRQSATNEEASKRDPENRLLGRGSGLGNPTR